MNRVARTAGFAACLLAVFVMAGGHRLALQTVAWACMIGDYSQRDSLATAFEKTFSGRHPCALCLEIRRDRQQEAQQGKKLPFVKTDKSPEGVCATRGVTVAICPDASRTATPFVRNLHSDFRESPPTPPPRPA